MRRCLSNLRVIGKVYIRILRLRETSRVLSVRRLTTQCPEHVDALNVINIILTHGGPVTPYGVTDIDQCIRRRKAITKTNSDLLSVGPTRTLFCVQLKWEHIFSAGFAH